MAIAGWVLFVIGVIALILGLIVGAKDVFKRQNSGSAQSALPTAFLEVLKALLEAPPAKFFCVLGLLLVVLGLALNGIEIFSTPSE